MVGSTPALWKSRRKGNITTSTYHSEFVALRMADEETIAMRYMRRCFGILVSENKPIKLFGDNKDVVDSVNIPLSKLKKKYCYILSFC